MPSKKYVVGTGALLEWALASWTEVAPDEVLCPIDVGQDNDYRFDFGSLEAVSPDGATAFVAWGPQFLNFRRLELMGELKARGFKMPPLVCQGAVVSATATLGDNCAVGAGAVVAAGCRIGFNSFLGSASVLGYSVRIGASAWIEQGVQVAAGAVIGAHATLGRGVFVGTEIEVGRRCVVDVPGSYVSAIAEGTHFLNSFRTPVVILNT